MLNWERNSELHVINYNILRLFFKVGKHIRSGCITTVMGRIFDITNSYQLAFLLCLTISIMAVILI